MNESVASNQSSRSSHDLTSLQNKADMENQEDSDLNDSSTRKSLHLDSDANNQPTGRPDRPRVEWIYPDGNNGDERNSGNRTSSHYDEASVYYVVDPSQTFVTLEVEGVVVHPRRCFVKMFGYVLCSDDFPNVVNMNLILNAFAIACFVLLAIYFIRYSISELKVL